MTTATDSLTTVITRFIEQRNLPPEVDARESAVTALFHQIKAVGTITGEDLTKTGFTKKDFEISVQEEAWGGADKKWGRSLIAFPQSE